MSVGSHRRRVDQNHAAIVDTFRRLGWSVQSLAAVGKGCPDLLVAKRGHTLVVEVKTAKGKLNAEQRAWVDGWQAAVFILQSPDDVVRLDRYGDGLARRARGGRAALSRLDNL